MQKDRLETYIDENRDAFDTELPGLNLWAEIDKQLHPEPKKPWFNTKAFRATAAILVLAVMGSTLLWANMNAPSRHLNEAPADPIAEQHPEFGEMKEFYARKINENMGRLAAANHHDPDLYRDIRQMELLYDTLRMDWEDNPHKSDEQLINAMIGNYQSRFELLEKVVNQLEYYQPRQPRRSPSIAQPAVFMGH